MNTNSSKSFTLMELLIVVFIIGVLIAIALPNFAKFRENSQRTACIANLRQINSAVDQWVIESGATTGSNPDEEAVYSYLTGPRPVCRAGGIYVIHAVGDPEQVTCSMASKGHRLGGAGPTQ